MTPVINLQRNPVLTPDALEHDPPASGAPAPIPEVVDKEGHPLGWSMREVRAMRFLRWLAEHGRIGGNGREISE